MSVDIGVIDGIIILILSFVLFGVIHSIFRITYFGFKAMMGFGFSCFLIVGVLYSYLKEGISSVFTSLWGAIVFIFQWIFFLGFWAIILLIVFSVIITFINIKVHNKDEKSGKFKLTEDDMELLLSFTPSHITRSDIEYFESLGTKTFKLRVDAYNEKDKKIANELQEEIRQGLPHFTNDDIKLLASSLQRLKYNKVNDVENDISQFIKSNELE